VIKSYQNTDTINSHVTSQKFRWVQSKLFSRIVDYKGILVEKLAEIPIFPYFKYKNF